MDKSNYNIDQNALRDEALTEELTAILNGRNEETRETDEVYRKLGTRIIGEETIDLKLLMHDPIYLNLFTPANNLGRVRSHSNLLEGKHSRIPIVDEENRVIGNNDVYEHERESGAGEIRILRIHIPEESRSRFLIDMANHQMHRPAYLQYRVLRELRETTPNQQGKRTDLEESSQSTEVNRTRLLAETVGLSQSMVYKILHIGDTSPYLLLNYDKHPKSMKQSISALYKDCIILRKFLDKATDEEKASVSSKLEDPEVLATSTVEQIIKSLRPHTDEPENIGREHVVHELEDDLQQVYSTLMQGLPGIENFFEEFRRFVTDLRNRILTASRS